MTADRQGGEAAEVEAVRGELLDFVDRITGDPVDDDTIRRVLDAVHSSGSAAQNRSRVEELEEQIAWMVERCNAAMNDGFKGTPNSAIAAVCDALTKQPCGWCHGEGALRDEEGKLGRDCPRCEGRSKLGSGPAAQREPVCTCGSKAIIDAGRHDETCWRRLWVESRERSPQDEDHEAVGEFAQGVMAARIRQLEAALAARSPQDEGHEAVERLQRLSDSGGRLAGDALRALRSPQGEDHEAGRVSPRDPRHQTAYRAVLDYCSHGIQGIGPFEAEEIVRLVEAAFSPFPERDTRAETVAEIVARLRAEADRGEWEPYWAPQAADFIEAEFGPARAQEPQEGKDG